MLKEGFTEKWAQSRDINQHCGFDLGLLQSRALQIAFADTAACSFALQLMGCYSFGSVRGAAEALNEDGDAPGGDERLLNGSEQRAMETTVPEAGEGP